MRQITHDELKTILENHMHWLQEDCDGWENMRANLYNADLRHANLYNADLSYANLSYADLSYAGLSFANLNYADLSYANLYNANLYNANLYNADLSYANLRNADLSYADLSNANLYNANLSNANLYNADLSNAYHLEEATGLYLLTICPSDGAFTGWKQCRDGIIAKLLIPEQAKRSNATGRKCRASEAVVMALYDEDGNEVDKAVSQHDADFVYRVGKTVKPTTTFDENRWTECAPGIHFFVTREEAERY